MILEKRVYTIFDLIKLAFKVAPTLAVVILVSRLMVALSGPALIVVTAHFINTSLAVVNEAVSPQQMVLPIVVLGLLSFLRQVVNVSNKYIKSKFLIQTRLSYRVELVEKRGKLAYRYIEDPDTYNLIKRITDSADTQIIDQYQNVLSLIDITIQVAGILIILLVNVWWVAPIIVLFSAPAFYFGAKAGKTVYEAERDVSKVERKAVYLAEVSSGRDAVLERTLFGYGDKVTRELWNRFEYVRVHKQAARKKTDTQLAISGMLTVVTAGSVMLVLLQPVATQLISVGLFISLTTASISLSNTLGGWLPNVLSKFTKDVEFLKELSQFAQLEEVEDALLSPHSTDFIFEKLVFKQVSFTYPGTEKKILDNVSFEIKPGKHYALVGENGAGKTTVIKLLTGQYLNYKGDILLNGKELKEYSSSDLKSVFSIAYQDFAKYQLSIRENIEIGDLESTTDDRLFKAISDFKLTDLINKLPKGVETSLGKITEDGVDLSGGQWQRIALARTIMNPAPIKILDEPTAALDPMSESRLYEQFEQIMEHTTSLFISHRLGSIKLADEILVFDKGTIIEQGRHTSLMAQKGKYALMYQSQLEWYKKDESEVKADA